MMITSSLDDSVDKIYYEDCEPGLIVRAGSITLSEADIIDFAGQWDPQPFHTDPQSPTNVVFGGHAASGWHTAVATMRMVVEGMGRRVAGGLVGMGIDELKWPRPTRPGDTLSVELTVLSRKRSSKQPGYGVVNWHWTTRNQHGEIAMTMKNASWMKCRSSEAGDNEA